MEKLQAALEKARKNRSAEIQLSSPVSADSNMPAPQDTSLDALWRSLPSFEVTASHLEESRIVTGEASAEATPLDILRTKVLLQMRQNGWKRLAITSPMPKSGKTTIACNLALGLGRQRDLRSILFDMDLRDPSVHKLFERVPQYGIGDLLTGKVGFSEQAMRLGDNVAVSMARGAVSDPTRLLLAEETADVLNRIEKIYMPDIIIFDLPSVLVNDETRAFLKNVDCALIVVRADITHYGQFDTCEREIGEQTNVLGVVLNAFRYHDPYKRSE